MKIDFRSFFQGPGSAYRVTGTAVAVVLAVGVGELYAIKANQQVAASPSPVASASPISTVSPEVTTTPSPSAEPTVSPSPSASASAAVLPASAQQSVADFYAAYKAKDRSKLETFFTADTTDELKSLRSLLFTGLDTNGNPGGPTLFSSNSAAQSVSSYAITGTAASGAGWQVTVSEQRVSGSGASAGAATTVIHLVPSGSGWLVDAYSYKSGGSGKYDAFLIAS